MALHDLGEEQCRTVVESDVVWMAGNAVAVEGYEHVDRRSGSLWGCRGDRGSGRARRRP